MKTKEEIVKIIEDHFGSEYKVNLSKCSVNQLKLTICWDFACILYGTPMYLNNEFITLNKNTMAIDNISDPTNWVIKDILELCF